MTAKLLKDYEDRIGHMRDEIELNLNREKKETKNMLQVGDVFKLVKGMEVYTGIPKRFLNYSSLREEEQYSFSEEAVKIGQVFPKHEKYDTSFMEGNYLVVRAKSEGGGTGHGPGDVYPDGWHVTARKLTEDNKYDPKGREVSFYQSGSFNCTNLSVPVIKRMTQTVTFV